MKVTQLSNRPVLAPCNLENMDYQVDPYGGCGHRCTYCYALNDAETDWTREIRIYDDITRRLRKELENIPPQRIYLSYYTDPYQPIEADYRQTRNVLEIFLEKGFSASILTKSDLVVRDMDLLGQMEDASVSVSVAFNDNQTRKQFEADTIDTEVRIGALRKLRENGITTNALVCPVVPYITDVTPLIHMLAPHTDTIWIYGLSIGDRSDRNWQSLKGILQSHLPDLKGRIETVLFSKEHPYWAKIRQDLNQLQKDHGLNLKIRL